MDLGTLDRLNMCACFLCIAAISWLVFTLAVQVPASPTAWAVLLELQARDCWECFMTGKHM